MAPENLAALAETPLDLLKQAREGTLFMHEVGDLNRAGAERTAAARVGKLDNYNSTRSSARRDARSPELVAQGVSTPSSMRRSPQSTVNVPSLRQHREDIPDLANLFLLRSIEAKEAPPRDISALPR